MIFRSPAPLFRKTGQCARKEIRDLETSPSLELSEQTAESAPEVGSA